MTALDEVEYAKLEAAITKIENQLIFSGVMNGSGSGALMRFISEARLRMANMDVQREHDLREKKQEDEKLQVYAASIERESALSREEKNQFGWFIRHDYFTKSMFGELDRFYTRTWDRLTEEGKTEMSQRVWEGVRRGEYEFLELPDSVKEKEAKRINAVLTKAGSRDALDAHVNAEDRQDFLAAYQSGARDTAYAVLNRRSFAEAMRGELGSEIVAVDATKDQEALKARIKTAMENPRAEVAPVRQNSPNLLADLDLDADVLSKLKASQDASPAAPTELAAPPSERRR